MRNLSLSLFLLLSAFTLTPLLLLLAYAASILVSALVMP
jgi:hypothetical protein